VITVIHCDGKLLIVDSLPRQRAKSGGGSLANLTRSFNLPGSGHACGTSLLNCDIKGLAYITLFDELKQELTQNDGKDAFAHEEEPVFLDWVDYENAEGKIPNVEHSAVFTLRVTPKEKAELICIDDYVDASGVKQNIKLGEHRWLPFDDLYSIGGTEELLDAITRIMNNEQLKAKLKKRIEN
jgi:hypothetical protein